MAHTELNLRERRAIEDMLNAKIPVSKIAAEIGRHRSTVFREIKRNRFVDEELPKLNGYARVISEMNPFKLPGEGILHINRTWRNNRIESDYPAPKKLITSMRGFKSLSSDKATRRGIDAIRTIKHGHVHGKGPGVTDKIRFVESLFDLAAKSPPPPREISRCSN